MENGKQMWGWQMESGCRGNRQMDRGSQRVGGYKCDFFIIVGFEYLKIKISKNHLSMVLLFLGELKNHLGPGLRHPKRGNYEMGVRVKICD